MKKLLAFILIVLSVLPLLIACASDPVDQTDTTESAAPPAPSVLTLTEEYVIVRSDNNKNEQGALQESTAVTLKKRIREEFGLDLRIVTDFVSEYENNRQAKEIIVGEIEGFGEEYTFDLTSVGDAGMTITTQGEKIILGARTTRGFGYAVDMLIANLTKTDAGLLFAPSEPLYASADQYYNDTMNFNTVKKMEIGDRTGLVSICYSTWFDYIYGSGSPTIPDSQVHDMNKILAGEAAWGPSPSFHHWGKPAQGYYRATSKEATENNMKLIGEAGVDFIIVDFTNYHAGYAPGTDIGTRAIMEPTKVLLDVVADRIEKGLPTPRVTFWCHDRWLFDMLWDNFFSKDKWENCFVYWDDKPFIMEVGYGGNNDDRYTVRGMWGLRGGAPEGQWSFLMADNSQAIAKWKDTAGNITAEQMPVCVACQETYMSQPTAHGRNHGIFFYQQWKNAFETQPKIITLTWWNEWCAQRLTVGAPYNQFEFTDAYGTEYSRDIEPMEGGHGDQYYRWMCEYIKAYRMGESCPVLVEEGYEDQVK